MALLAGLTGSAQEQAKPFVPVADEVLVKPNPADWLMWRRTFDSSGFTNMHVGHERHQQAGSVEPLRIPPRR